MGMGKKVRKDVETKAKTLGWNVPLHLVNISAILDIGVSIYDKLMHG